MVTRRQAFTVLELGDSFKHGESVVTAWLPYDAEIEQVKVSIDNGTTWIPGKVAVHDRLVKISATYHGTGKVKLSYIPSRDELVLTEVRRPFFLHNTMVCIYYATNTPDTIDILVASCKGMLSRTKEKLVSFFR